MSANHGVTIIGIVAAVAGAFGAQYLVRSWLTPKQDIRSAQVLTNAASELNKSLPMMIDSETELVATMGFDGIFAYNYRLINVTAAEIETNKLLAVLKPQVKNSACTTPETRDTFLKQGITMRYSYADKDRVHIASFDIHPSDCGF